jgi:hypothetical protein
MLLDPRLLPFLLCLMAAPSWRCGVASHAVSIAAVFTSILLAFNMSLSPDDATIPRYVQPLLVSAALAALMTGAIAPRRQIAAWALGILLVVVNWPERCEGVWDHYRALAHSNTMRVPFHLGLVADYREAQQLVPEGKRALVCADFPYLFDHRRNDLWIIDLPNATSPAPGLPFQKAPEEMKRYLRGLGIEYIICVDFGKSYALYNRATWQKHAQGNVELWKIQSAFYLDFFDSIDRLAASETKLGRVGYLNVLQFTP